MRSCPICEIKSTKTVLPLPGLPVNGEFVPHISDDTLITGPKNEFNNALLYCDSCNHGFLDYHVPYHILYGDFYDHQTSHSTQAVVSNDNFFEFIKNNTCDIKTKHVVEFGSSDLYLAKRLSTVARRVTAIDPSLRASDTPTVSDVEIIADTAENFFSTHATDADLIISAHTLEHIQDPRGLVSMLAEVSKPDVRLAFLVPSFDSLVRLSRFDLIFHQRYHYFSIKSLTKLFYDLGYKLLNFKINPKGFGGGI